MNVKLKRLATKALRNSEHPIFINQIVVIADKHHPADLHLSKPFEKLKLTLPQLAKVKAQEKGSDLSNKLHDLDVERDNLIKTISAQGTNFANLNMPALTPHALVLNRMMDKHGRDMPADTYNAETKRIDDFIFDYENDVEVKNAVEALYQSENIISPKFGYIKNIL